MAISPIFSIVEVKFFVMRLVVFFVFVGLLIVLFIGAVEITKTSEDERAANSIAETLMASSLAETKGVFTLTGKIGEFSIIDLSGTNLELPRYCNYGTLFTLEELQGQRRRWSWGYGNGNALSTKKYIVWMKDGPATRQSLLSIALRRDQLTQFSCSIERAFAYKQIQEFDIRCDSGECFYFRQDQNFCTSSGANPETCRWLPQIPIEEFNIAGSEKIYVVPIKEGGDSSCPGRGAIPTGAFRTDDDRKNFNVDRIAFCLR